MQLNILTPYQRLGGEPKIHELVNRFYELMDTLPEAQTIRAMHERDLSAVKQVLFDFLSGWLGGPNFYVEKYGHPRLRARHLPFAIGERERDEWLLCMYQAMRDIGLSEELQKELQLSFFRTADFLRNKEEVSNT
ncbi:group II truncated hemoglobin [Beggiatoa leptomitoformis]|uniref:Hemoglobin-like protein n=1 Tax=Beggiatoa leptomitoformis TaxID=288004 RepID=A0A650GE02_9GAMM|nr:group II truncated hemoglobin [Beggiatoa leptomitoformis]ALG66907.2 hemoglobin-like protein [Beggiatoa leptomitoformis]QGX04039.1 hemoglobin-like protein [Beggiatoa leptomitoformis]